MRVLALLWLLAAAAAQASSAAPTARQQLSRRGAAILLPLEKHLQFAEIATPLQAVLQLELAASVPILAERASEYRFGREDRTVYVILGVDAFFLGDEATAESRRHLRERLPRTYIVYQFEQLQAKAAVVSSAVLEAYGAQLRGAACIWEYAAHLLPRHRPLGVPAVHVPLAYHPSMAYAPSPSRHLDVVWVGNTAGRRVRIVRAWEEQLATTEPPLAALLGGARAGNAIWNNAEPRAGELSDAKSQVVSAARLAFNVHMHEPADSSLEVVRILYFIANRVHVLSEPSGDAETDALFAPHVTFCRHEEMVPTAQRLLAEPERLARRAEAALAWAAARPYSDRVRHALSQPLPLPAEAADDGGDEGEGGEGGEGGGAAAAARSSLHEIALRTGTDKASYHQYTLFYEQLLAPWRDADFYLLEIGVHLEQSLRAWDEYFPRARVFGADVDGAKMGSERILQLDQANATQLREAAALRPWSVVVDDGSHVPAHQLQSFLLLFPALPAGGVYIIEDLETSYWHPSRSIYGYPLHGQPDVPALFLRAARDAVNREFHCEAPPPVFSAEIDAQIGSVEFIRNALVVRKPPEGYVVRAEYRWREAACQSG